jgi:hypothetical protein
LVSLPQLPGFTVTGRLGAGGTGTVWSATREADGRPVALKLVAGAGDAWEDTGTGPRSGSAAEQAAREAGLLAGIDHPHVVRLHEATALADGTVVLVLDLVDGGSYAAVVAARGHLHPGEVVTSLAPVARAVAHLHTLGVVHADLSPGNVLFTRQGKPMVSDLGVARLFGEVPDQVHGTEGFTAPEVVLGAPPTPASDVYAIGALARFGLTGAAPPTPGLGPPSGSVLEDQPLRLVQLIERCLSADPGVRPTAASVAVDLFDAAVAEPVQLGDGSDPAASITHRIRASARSSPPPEPARRGLRGRFRRPPMPRALRPAGAGLLLVVGLAVVLGGDAAGWIRGAGASAPGAPTANRVRAAEPVGTPGGGTSAGATGGRASGADPAPVAPHGDGSAGAARVRAELRSSPRAVLQRLADARARSYQSGDVGLLDAVDVAGSPSRARDQQVIRGAAAVGASYTGLRYLVRSAEMTSTDGAWATVRARVDTSAHTVVARDGHRGQRPATAGVPVTISLRWTPAGWRIHR